MWPAIQASFDGAVKADSWDAAYDRAYNHYQHVKMASRETFDNLLCDKTLVVGFLTYESFLPILSKASQGSNDAVEEVEYSYCTREVVKGLVLNWYARGIFGRSKADAFLATCGISIMDMNLDSFDEAFKLFAHVGVSVIGGTKDSAGQRIDPALYKPLPPLWPNPFGSDNIQAPPSGNLLYEAYPLLRPTDIPIFKQHLINISGSCNIDFTTMAAIIDARRSIGKNDHEILEDLLRVNQVQ